MCRCFHSSFITFYSVDVRSVAVTIMIVTFLGHDKSIKTALCCTTSPIQPSIQSDLHSFHHFNPRVLDADDSVATRWRIMRAQEVFSPTKNLSSRNGQFQVARLPVVSISKRKLLVEQEYTRNVKSSVSAFWEDFLTGVRERAEKFQAEYNPRKKKTSDHLEGGDMPIKNEKRKAKSLSTAQNLPDLNAQLNPQTTHIVHNDTKIFHTTPYSMEYDNHDKKVIEETEVGLENLSITKFQIQSNSGNVRLLKNAYQRQHRANRRLGDDNEEILHKVENVRRKNSKCSVFEENEEECESVKKKEPAILDHCRSKTSPEKPPMITSESSIATPSPDASIQTTTSMLLLPSLSSSTTRRNEVSPALTVLSSTTIEVPPTTTTTSRTIITATPTTNITTATTIVNITTTATEATNTTTTSTELPIIELITTPKVESSIASATTVTIAPEMITLITPTISAGHLSIPTLGAVQSTAIGTTTTTAATVTELTITADGTWTSPQTTSSDNDTISTSLLAPAMDSSNQTTVKMTGEMRFIEPTERKDLTDDKKVEWPTHLITELLSRTESESSTSRTEPVGVQVAKTETSLLHPTEDNIFVPSFGDNSSDAVLSHHNLIIQLSQKQKELTDAVATTTEPKLSTGNISDTLDLEGSLNFSRESTYQTLSSPTTMTITKTTNFTSTTPPTSDTIIATSASIRTTSTTFLDDRTKSASLLSSAVDKSYDTTGKIPGKMRFIEPTDRLANAERMGFTDDKKAEWPTHLMTELLSRTKSESSTSRTEPVGVQVAKTETSLLHPTEDNIFVPSVGGNSSDVALSDHSLIVQLLQQQKELMDAIVKQQQKLPTDNISDTLDVKRFSNFFNESMPKSSSSPTTVTTTRTNRFTSTTMSTSSTRVVTSPSITTVTTSTTPFQLKSTMCGHFSFPITSSRLMSTASIEELKCIFHNGEAPFESPLGFLYGTIIQATDPKGILAFGGTLWGPRISSQTRCRKGQSVTHVGNLLQSPLQMYSYAYITNAPMKPPAPLAQQEYIDHKKSLWFDYTQDFGQLCPNEFELTRAPISNIILEERPRMLQGGDSRYYNRQLVQKNDRRMHVGRDDSRRSKPKLTEQELSLKGTQNVLNSSSNLSSHGLTAAQQSIIDFQAILKSAANIATTISQMRGRTTEMTYQQPSVDSQNLKVPFLSEAMRPVGHLEQMTSSTAQNNISSRRPLHPHSSTPSYPPDTTEELTFKELKRTTDLIQRLSYEASAEFWNPPSPVNQLIEEIRLVGHDVQRNADIYLGRAMAPIHNQYRTILWWFMLSFDYSARGNML